MNRVNYSEKFSSYMIGLNQLIETNGKLNLLSSHVHAEYFYRDLLNVLFQYSLENINEVDPNATAIDLIDEQNKIIIQVSATCTKAKIESALSKEIIYDYVKDDYHMKFVFIGTQKESIKGKDYVNPYDIKFDSTNDILLTNDLHKKFINLNINNQTQVISWLKKELEPVVFNDAIFELTDEFIDHQLQSNIKSLGPRYSPELNVTTDNMLAFEAITISDSFQKDNNKHLKDIIDSVERIKDFNLESQKAKDYYHKFKEEIENKIIKINLFLNNKVSFHQKIEKLKEIEIELENIQDISDRYSLPEIDLVKDDENTINNHFMDIQRSISQYNLFLENTCHKTLYNPFLLLYGEAGIGKSHLLADMAINKREQGHIVFLLLGQHFTDKINPWDQIMSSLDLELSINEYLSAIEVEAENSGRRAIFIIDALNEGEGRLLWKNYFQKFLEEIKQYPNICLIFSIRTPFIDQILPDEFIHSNKISEHEHIGFANENYSPVKAFCEYYEIEEPVFPLLNPEYNNPLFLKLVCQLHANRKQSSFSDDIRMSTLFLFIIEDVNKKLSDVSRLDYDSSLDVIQEVLNEVVTLQHQSPYREMKYSDVYKVIRNAAVNYTKQENKVLEALIYENILIDTVNYRKERVVYFAYERMGDYLLAEYLLKPYKVDRENSLKDIRQNENFNKYFSTESDMSFNMGLIEALSVIMPEEFDMEFFEVYSDRKNNFNIQNAFVDSLIWRTAESITEKTKKYIKEYVFSRELIVNQFLDVLIQKSCVSNHPLNAHALTKILFQLNLPERDTFWTTKISNEDNNILKIINWSWENTDNISSNTVELYEIILIWILSSTNRYVRDSSTKALASLFKQNPHTMVSMLEKFESIDDPYILERLYAAIFGGVVRSEEQEFHPKIAIYIYYKIFKQSEVYPYILLRDYARQTIEFIMLTFDISEINEANIKPPYKSIWYEHIPTNDEIDELQVEKTNEKNAYTSMGVNRIINSMTTEYGRGTGGYGDFGRYIFGSKVRAWKNQFESDQELSNIAIKRVFEMGYNIDLHGNYDLRVSRHDKHNNLIERIGKKYQWIAFHELMAKLTDNFPIYENKKIYTKEYEDYLTSRYNSLKDNIYSNSQKEIKKLNENDHIKEIIKIPLDQYKGPWEPFLRDIDPTFLLKEIPSKKYELIPSQLPENPSVKWVKNKSSEEDISKYLEINFDDEAYIALYTIFRWEYKDKDKKFNEREEKLFNSSGIFIKNYEKESFLKEVSTVPGGEVPITGTYTIFAFENFWSESYVDFEDEFYDNKNTNQILACHEYMWETDHSIKNKEITNYILPSKKLVNYFEIKQTKEGIWRNNKNEVICFDASILGYDNCLLIKKEELLKFLEEHDYSLMWKAYTQKLAHKYMNRTWYTIDYNNGKYEKYGIDEEVHKNKRS